jgi:hypothetical protein
MTWAGLTRDVLDGSVGNEVCGLVHNLFDGGVRLVARLFALGIGYHDHLPQNLIQLIPSTLLVSSPLDECVQAQVFDDFASILPAGLS